MFGFNSQLKTITPKDAHERLASDKGITLLDVRNPEEYIQKHIPNSVNIPLNVLPQQIEQQVPDKNATIFVYCLSGSRSMNACRFLDKMGYTNVYNMGGINSWFFETVSGR